MSYITLIGLSLFLVGAQILSAQQPLLGAKKSIESIKQALQPPTTNTVEDNRLTTEEFEAQIRDYQRNQPHLPQDKQIQEWVSLTKLINRVQFDKYRHETSNRHALIKAFTHLLDAIPPAESWSRIQQALQQEASCLTTNVISPQADSPATTKNEVAAVFGSTADYNLAFQYVLACLLNDRVAFCELVKIMQNKRNSSTYSWLSKADIEDLMVDEEGQEQSRVSLLERDLPKPHDYFRTLSPTPDILSTVGRQRTEAIARRMLKSNNDYGNFRRYGFKTKEAFALVQNVALSTSDELSKPCWELVDNSKTGWTLYQVLKQKFKTPRQRTVTQTNETDFAEENDSVPTYPFIDASAYAVQYLIETKNIDAATQLTLTLSKNKLTNFSGFNDLIEKVYYHSTESDATLYPYLSQVTRGMGTQWPLCYKYIEKSLASGHRPDVETQLNARLNHPGISLSNRLALLDQKLSLFLAEDRYDESATIIRQIINESKQIRMPQSSITIFDISEFLSKAIHQAGLIGQRDLQKACITRLLDLFSMQLADLPSNIRRSSYFLQLDVNSMRLLQILQQHDQLPAFEYILTQSILQSVKPNDDPFSKKSDASELLTQLAILYDFMGRAEDVLTLFEEAPWWGPYRDITEFYDSSSMRPVLARALLRVGRTAEANQLLHAELTKNHSQDWMYESLLQLTGTNLHAFIQEMDRLYATDAFEERPLIWKAEALRRLKNLKEAETTIRLALKVDPTDGEQKENNRARGYAVLADILADQGKNEDAKFFRDVVQAVRLAEEGDRLKKHGLIKRSLARYAEAEKLFPDAYCVQWRLAEQLSQLGQETEAEKHYTIAFERMPEQFGHVASLCFGCEGIFGKNSSRSVGERVLLRLANQPNPQPTVFYLLGKLRESQNQFDEAYTYFKKASGMDAGYLDALTRMMDLCQNRVTRPLKEMQALQLTILKLDPLGHHSDLTILKGNLAEFWKIRNTALALQPPLPEMILPLKANVQRIENEEDKEASSFYSANESLKTAADVYLDSKEGLFLDVFISSFLRQKPRVRKISAY